MQNNNGTLVLQPTLTSLGKKRLLEDEFKISKFALADDGINYKLINENIIDPELAVKRTPVLSVWKDSSFNLNNKIFIDNLVFPSENDFNPSITNIEGGAKVHPVGFGKEVDFPRVVKEEENITIQYFLTDNEVADSINKMRISFSPNVVDGNIFNGDTVEGLKTIIATISETTYFDIQVERNNPNVNILMDKNFGRAFKVEEEKQKFPKVVNVYCGDDIEEHNSFIIHYKGNFMYEDIDADIYETTINLTSEYSGKSQVLKLQIIPTSKQKENN